MRSAAAELAAYASALRYDEVPAEVLERARQCVIDTIGVSLLGARLPWGAIVARYAQRFGAGGAARLIGHRAPVSAPLAALANGVFAHGFELDSLREPGAGVHPGAALVPAALALGEELGASGTAVLCAIVAGCEVMFRIGAAGKHSSEALGFHAPGLTGPFGAAVCAGRLLGLDAQRLTDAIGIAGSLCSGLLAFADAQRGAMVKRLHLGRAAESGVLAATLAQDGFEGPPNILEGRFGFLSTYCREPDPQALTRDLGTRFETLRICIKRYPCHVTAHTPIESVRALRAEHGFLIDDIAAVTVRASAKVLSHHANPSPADVMAAQYSVPFCVAVALGDDPADPRAFLERALADPKIRRVARSVAIEVLPRDAPGSAWASEVAIRLRDGRTLERRTARFPGMPEVPLAPGELRAKFSACAGGFAPADALLDQLEHLERVADVRALRLA